MGVLSFDLSVVLCLLAIPASALVIKFVLWVLVPEPEGEKSKR